MSEITTDKQKAHSINMEWIEDKDGVCYRPMLFNEDGSRQVRMHPDPCEFVSREQAKGLLAWDLGDKTTLRPELSFDGFGINGPDEYRTRLCTFRLDQPEVARKYGPLFEAAPELLEALKDLVKADDLKMGRKAVKLRLAIARDAIAKAEGRQS